MEEGNDAPRMGMDDDDDDGYGDGGIRVSIPLLLGNRGNDIKLCALLIRDVYNILVTVILIDLCAKEEN